MLELRPRLERAYKRLDTQFGLFFEDLNHAADGGLYAELLENRDFEFDAVDWHTYNALTGWAPIAYAEISVETKDAPFSENPHYALVRTRAGGGICNLGFGTGIPVQAGQAYRLRMWARSDTSTEIDIELCGGSVSFLLNDEWTCFEAELRPTETNRSSRLTILAPKGGIFSLAYVSLMPVDTWKGRKNGLRRDLVEALYEMKPRFLRFPGGCLTHDGDLNPDARDGIYNWKKTLGPVENRPARRNSWGYHQTLGLGFFELFQLCEDLDCEPIPVVNGGIDPHHLRFAEDELLDRYIEDAVDLIEFATGDTNTTYGKIRAEMGHPTPFRLHYIAVGNEEIHQRFHEHMERFAAALRKACPGIQLIGSASPVVHGKPHDMGWSYARAQKLELVDEHYYQAPEWFLANQEHYASYPADGPKVFLGEYASWGNRMGNALAEAAYMVGLQNAPAVAMCCYAPLLCHVNYANWRPDLLYYDGYRILKTANYEVQKMFMRHLGDEAIPLDVSGNDWIHLEDLPMEGEFQILSDDTLVQLCDIRLDAKSQRSVPDTILMENQSLSLGNVRGDFTLTLVLRRLSGKKGIFIRFDVRDADTYFQWTVGGWQNSDSGIDQHSSRGNSCLTQSNFTLQSGRDTYLTLIRRGREIITMIDGAQMNRIEVAEMKLRPVYFAGSIENASGDIIIKAVNVRSDSEEATLHLGHGLCKVEELCAFPDAENEMGKPPVVYSTHSSFMADGSVPYVFRANSITALKFHPYSKE